MTAFWIWSLTRRLLLLLLFTDHTSTMVRHDVCHYGTARSLSDPLDGQRMLTAVLWWCSSDRLSTGVHRGVR